MSVPSSILPCYPSIQTFIDSFILHSFIRFASPLPLISNPFLPSHRLYPLLHFIHLPIHLFLLPSFLYCPLISLFSSFYPSKLIIFLTLLWFLAFAHFPLIPISYRISLKSVQKNISYISTCLERVYPQTVSIVRFMFQGSSLCEWTSQ